MNIIEKVKKMFPQSINSEEISRIYPQWVDNGNNGYSQIVVEYSDNTQTPISLSDEEYNELFLKQGDEKKMKKLYKNYVINETSCLIDYRRDFELENFNYDFYEEEIERKIHNETKIIDVYFLNDSYQMQIICESVELEEQLQELIGDIGSELDQDEYYF